MEFLSMDFLMALGSIIVLDIVLGGDNAVVIAMASRDLPQSVRKANWPIPWLKNSRPLPMRWRSKPRWMKIFTASAWMC